MTRDLATVERLVVQSHSLGSSGAYLGPHGEPVASFRYDNGGVQITDDLGRPVLTVMRHRDLFGTKQIPGLPRRNPHHFRPRSGFALMDEHHEAVGLVWPNSRLFANRWSLRLETAEQRATLRARSALSQWNADHTSKELLFELVPATVGTATVSFEWERDFSATTTIQIKSLSSVHGALLQLVIAAPHCLFLAGMTGVPMPSGQIYG